MFCKTTEELKEYIEMLYSKVRPIAERDDIYCELDVLNVYFAEGTLQSREGIYCYTKNNRYHYFETERGRILIDNITTSLFEISYWIVNYPISTMAREYELKHRVGGQDTRRIMFEKKLKLFEQLGGNYKKRAEIDIDEILKEAPYVNG